MNDSQAIYYLSSLDSIRFEPTRKCTFLKELKFRSGKACALVKLDPPVIGQDYGLGEDLEWFVLTNRHEGEGLYPIQRFPCFVFITRPLIDNIETRLEIDKDDVQIIGWGELYRTESDADQHVFDKA